MSKITKQQIITEKNNTPVGFASWCWAADIGYDEYQARATEKGITPLSEEDFNFVINWWKEQYYA